MICHPKKIQYISVITYIADLPINDSSVYGDSILHCRYLVICYPMKAQYISTPSRAKKIISVVWVAAIGLSVAPTYFVSGVKLSESKKETFV